MYSAIHAGCVLFLIRMQELAEDRREIANPLVRESWKENLRRYVQQRESDIQYYKHQIAKYDEELSKLGEQISKHSSENCKKCNNSLRSTLYTLYNNIMVSPLRKAREVG